MGWAGISCRKDVDRQSDMALNGLLSDLIVAAPAQMYEANNRRGVAGPTRPTGLVGLVWDIARNIHHVPHLILIITTTSCPLETLSLNLSESDSWGPACLCPHRPRPWVASGRCEVDKNNCGACAAPSVQNKSLMCCAALVVVHTATEGHPLDSRSVGRALYARNPQQAV